MPWLGLACGLEGAKRGEQQWWEGETHGVKKKDLNVRDEAGCVPERNVFQGKDRTGQSGREENTEH